MADLPLIGDVDQLTALLGPGASQPSAYQALSRASSRFRGEVRHPVTLIENDEVWLDGTGGRTLLLPAAPVVDVDTVEVDGRPAVFDWSADGMLVLRSGCWPDRLRTVRVVYSHGYDPVPDDIIEAVLTAAQSLYEARPGVSSMQVGGQTVSWSASMLEASVAVTWDAVVARYRLNRGDLP